MFQAAHFELVSALAVKAAREINPSLQIGCMIAMCPIYPLSCAPNDMMMAMNAMHRRYWFTDVHVRPLSAAPAELLRASRFCAGHHRRRPRGADSGLRRLYRL